MERNINFVLIGALFLSIVIAMVVFVFWIGGGNLNQEKFQQYVAYSPEGISGIGVGTAVRYKGIAVGKVKNVGFKKDDIDLIQIDFEIKSEITLKEGACITPETQGLAGNTFLSITQGEGKALGQNGVLCFKKDFVGRLMNQIEEGGGDVREILANIKTILNDENAKNIQELITSLKVISKNLEQTQKHIDKLAISTQGTIEQINNGITRGDYNIRAILSPAILGLESTMGEVNRFFSKANFLLDRIEKSPYDTIFGQREQKKEK